MAEQGNTSRFTSNPFRKPGLTPEQVQRIDERNAALREYRETGDPTRAVEAGLFPSRDVVDKARREIQRAKEMIG